MLLSRLAAPLAILSCLAAPAAAQFDLFPWSNTPGGGEGSSASLTPSGMVFYAGWADPFGFQGYLTTAPVDGFVSVTMEHYMAFDGFCGASVPVFSHNGELTVLATCSASDLHFDFPVAAGDEFGFGLGTYVQTWPGTAAFSGFRFTPTERFAYWTDLGEGLGGLLGPPNLVGQGLLHGGMPIKLKVTNAAPHNPATLVIGLSALDAPFKGGVMVPTPDLLISGMFIGMGTLNLSASWPNGLPPGLQLWMQFWVVDPTAPLGLSATNGLLAATP